MGRFSREEEKTFSRQARDEIWFNLIAQAAEDAVPIYQVDPLESEEDEQVENEAQTKN